MIKNTHTSTQNICECFYYYYNYLMETTQTIIKIIKQNMLLK